jgi:hypothetical protein
MYSIIPFSHPVVKTGYTKRDRNMLGARGLVRALAAPSARLAAPSVRAFLSLCVRVCVRVCVHACACTTVYAD